MARTTVKKRVAKPPAARKILVNKKSQKKIEITAGDKNTQVLAATVGGAVLGNLILPGIGGAIVGGLVGAILGNNSDNKAVK